MGRYAETTRVPVVKSRSDIEQVLTRYGADGFGFASFGNAAEIHFRYNGKHFKFRVEIPESEQENRQRWRALLLVIKAKLEAIESGISTFEQEFLAFIALPSGGTTGEAMIPEIENAYRTGRLPNMSFLGLPAPDGGGR